MRMFIGLLIVVLFCQCSSADASPWRVVVLANTVDGGQASGFYKFLEDEGIAVVKTDSNAFEPIRGSQDVVILGGQNSPEGVGGIVSKLLSEDEKKSLLLPGSIESFVKENIFSSGQKIHVFAGYGTEDTKAAWIKGMEELKDSIIGQTAQITVLGPRTVYIAPKSNIKSYSIPVNVSNSGDSPVSGIEVEALLNGGIRLETDPSTLDIGAGKSLRVMVKLDPKNITNADRVLVGVGGSKTSILLNVSSYERIDKICNICAASGLP
jgi:hypothetical protein